MRDKSLEIDLSYKSLCESLVKGMVYIIVTPILFGVISIVLVFIILKPQYTSEAKLLIKGDSNNSSSLVGIASQFGIAFPSDIGFENYYLSTETIPELIHSQNLLESVMFSEYKNELHNESVTLFEYFYSGSKFSEHDKNKLIVLGLKRISKEMLRIHEMGNTSIFKLEVTSPEPYLSTQIALNVISELQELQIDFNVSELGRQYSYINSRLLDVQSELQKAESKLKHFREENLQISLSPTLQLQRDRLQREIDIQTGVYISLKQQIEKIKINSNKNISTLKIIDEPSIPVFHSKPKRKLIVGLSILTGLLLSSMFAVIKNY